MTKPAEIISVYELIVDSRLYIPEYQRPYKWTNKHINELFYDIATHNDKSAYRLGTIVLHWDGQKKNIADGQQRIISLLLAAHALIQRNKNDNIGRKDLQGLLCQLKENMVNPTFTSEISKINIRSNYLEVQRIVSRSDFTEAQIDFLLNKCEVVVVRLGDVSEAFQFFDSQNARGRDLEPHDLLKAYHLREFSPLDEHLKEVAVERWESSDTEDLAMLFSQYLYRIRNWSKGESARYFGKDDSYLFKGVNIDTAASYPYIQQLRIAHQFVDQYNGQYERKIDSYEFSFPFQLDQTIINGRRFFELINHYQAKIDQIGAKYKRTKSNTAGHCSVHELFGPEKLDGFAQEILKTLNEYSARNRTGDRYVRAMFDCLLIYYIDKFGNTDISMAIEKIFIWAYSLRLQKHAVQLASMDNHVLENNLFHLIKYATRHHDVINYSPPKLHKKIDSSKTIEPIETLFKKMKYYE